LYNKQVCIPIFLFQKNLRPTRCIKINSIFQQFLGQQTLGQQVLSKQVSLPTISWPTIPGQTVVLIARVYSINSLDSKYFGQLFILQASLFYRKAMTSKSFSFLIGLPWPANLLANQLYFKQVFISFYYNNFLASQCFGQHVVFESSLYSNDSYPANSLGYKFICSKFVEKQFLGQQILWPASYLASMFLIQQFLSQ
jgi:hypothetical protein